jgi:hypothetical protein
MRSIALVAAIAAVATLALPAHADDSRGFTARRAHCAVALPHLPGLVCAPPAIRARQYDGRGVVQLLPNGHVVVRRSGSDLLLSVDGNRDETTRPLLRAGTTWRAAGFTCTNRAQAVVCSRAGHGFRLTAVSFRRF